MSRDIRETIESCLSDGYCFDVISVLALKRYLTVSEKESQRICYFKFCTTLCLEICDTEISTEWHLWFRYGMSCFLFFCEVRH